MKKTSLVLFPVLAALLLAGCTGTRKPRKKKSSSEVPVSGSVTPTPTSGGKPTSGVTPTSQTPSPTSQTPTPTGDPTFNLTPGSHVTTLDFVNNSATYKETFPGGKSEATTGIMDSTLAGIDVKSVGSWVNTGYVMMKNKDSFATNHGFAFIASQTSLGNITSISLTTTSGDYAPKNAVYNIAILSSPVTAEGGSSSGQSFTGTGTFNAQGSGSYFCITTTNNNSNGQIASLTVSYTIS